MKKAQYFITCKELPLQMLTVNELSPQRVRSLLLPKPKKKVDERQLRFDFWFLIYEFWLNELLSMLISLYNNLGTDYTDYTDYTVFSVVIAAKNPH